MGEPEASSGVDLQSPSFVMLCRVVLCSTQFSAHMARWVAHIDSGLACMQALILLPGVCSFLIAPAVVIVSVVACLAVNLAMRTRERGRSACAPVRCQMLPLVGYLINQTASDCQLR